MSVREKRAKETIDVTLTEANAYPIEKVRALVKDLRPYVWVVGSYAMDEQRLISDFDMMPKRKTLAECEAGDNDEEYYHEEIREVLKKHGFKSTLEGFPPAGTWSFFAWRTIDIAHFDLPSEVKIVTKRVSVLNVEMECLEYDRTILGDGMGFETDWIEGLHY